MARLPQTAPKADPTPPVVPPAPVAAPPAPGDEAPPVLFRDWAAI